MLSRLSTLLSCLALAGAVFRCDNRPDKRSSLAGIQLWTENTVPYEIDDVYTPYEKQVIRDSLEEVTALTDGCVRFVEHSSPDTAWVKVVSKSG